MSNSKLEKVKKSELATDEFYILDRDEPDAAVVQQGPAVNSPPENAPDRKVSLKLFGFGGLP